MDYDDYDDELIADIEESSIVSDDDMDIIEMEAKGDEEEKPDEPADDTATEETPPEEETDSTEEEPKEDEVTTDSTEDTPVDEETPEETDDTEEEPTEGDEATDDSTNTDESEDDETEEEVIPAPSKKRSLSRLDDVLLAIRELISTLEYKINNSSESVDLDKLSQSRDELLSLDEIGEELYLQWNKLSAGDLDTRLLEMTSCLQVIGDGLDDVLK